MDKTILKSYIRAILWNCDIPDKTLREIAKLLAEYKDEEVKE